MAGDSPGVTLLHVSDTQFGQYHRFDPSDSLAGHLIRDVVRLADDDVPAVDLVVLSGDIAERGRRPEYVEARAFVDAICRSLSVGLDRVVVVPGNHDVNWSSSKAYFADCEEEEVEPDAPYPRKWRFYQEFITGLHGPTSFTEEQPYRLHRFDELRVVVAAMNSTILESHRQDDHYGWLGNDQLRWFADQLAAVGGALRIGVLHHNARRRAQADNENLRDEPSLTGILRGHLDLLLHGHTHEGKEDRLPDGTLVLATGSAAVTMDWRPSEVPNQYQVLHLRPGQVTRWARQWDAQHQRWIADPRVSADGNTGRVDLALGTPGWTRRRGRAARKPAPRDKWSGRRNDFVAQVELVTRRDLGEQTAVEQRRFNRLDYLVAFPPAAPMRCIGVYDGALSPTALREFDQRLFSPLRSRGAIELMMVHHGPDDPDMRVLARSLGVRVKTWTEYNDLLDPGLYREWLRRALNTDPLYPQPLYQPQRFREISRFGRADDDVRDDLLRTISEAVLDEEGRFVLVLGEAGFGKSFLIRRLAHQMLTNERLSITPIVIYLRDRDKRQSIDEMVSAVLLPSRATFRVDRFEHSLEAGTLALLVDGYDEFAVRVGYANAAAQLRTFVDAMRGRARVVLTTRPNHFRSRDEVTSKLFDQLRTVHNGLVYQLEPFDRSQQRAFLARWFELRSNRSPNAMADRWMAALSRVDNLPELAHTPRMLSFMAEDLSLASIEGAAGSINVTAAELYQRLVDRWLSGEATKVDPNGPGTMSARQRQQLLEQLALRLWRSGERDVTENALHEVIRDAVALPRLELTLDQAAQDVGGRTLLQVDEGRWRFAHQSIWEFLLARCLAGLLRSGGADDLLGEAELTSLTLSFLRDLAPEEGAAWAARVARRRHE